MKTYFIVIFIVLIAGGHALSQELKPLNESEKQEMIERHNYWRAKVGVESLTWSEDLAEYAAEWAMHLAKEKGCTMQHRPREGTWKQQYGENLFIGTDEYNSSYVCDQWASERKHYNNEKITRNNYKKVGHYTQIVWFNTKKVGCARVVCNGKEIWVCNYSPPGNTLNKRAH